MEKVQITWRLLNPHESETQTSQPVFGARRSQQAQSHGQHGNSPVIVCLIFAPGLIPNQKTRFWKASGLLLALFVAYIIYLNFIGFHLRSSKQPSAEFAQHLQQQPENGAQASRKEQQKSQTSAESSHNYDQKPQNQHQQQQQARFSGTPEKLKAVALKSIPHDTSAFTQVSAQPGALLHLPCFDICGSGIVL